MSGIVSVHLADIGARRTLELQARTPKAGRVAGLRHADVGITAPLTETILPKPTLGRAGLIAFWDDRASLDAFLAEHPVAATLAGGWHAVLVPVRVHGAWPGLDEGLPRSRRVEPEGPAIVLTMGRLRVSQTVRFLKTSAKAEAGVLAAPGVRWATGLARPPFFATISAWESDAALSAYAYGPDQRAHDGALDQERARPFHRRSAFVRLRALSISGELTGANPLPADVLG
jgi:hypothetical protein